MNGTEDRPSVPVPLPAVRTVLLVLVGPIVWGLHLTLIYGIQSVVCSVQASPLGPALAGLDMVQLAILAVTVLAGAAVAAAPVTSPPLGAGNRSGASESLRSFLHRVMRVLAVLSVLGIIGAGSAAVVFPTCSGLR